MTNNINGIDVSEEIRYCNNCSNLGLDFKTGKLYCGLSNRNDELPEILSCENFSLCCYIKRLQKENEGLKSLNDFNVQKIEVLQEENEKLKAENEQLKKPCLVMPKVKQLAVPIEKYEKLYKALEKIRKEANRLLYEENPIYGYNNSNHFEMLAKYVLAKTKEVLEDNEDVENN